ncbi:MAG: hypothetical protein MUC41_05065 [Syntrophobacteraceae bacterium]|jgi:hypothetical protein|nr:hypothetical protein [Syntrophobacteraceae bacterium]
MGSLKGDIPEEIISLCGSCTEAFNRTTDPDSHIALARHALRGLLLDRTLFVRLMESILEGASFPDIQRPTLFDNEILLYQEPDRLYSLRMYIWGPGEYTPVHDHNSWGVIGTVTDGFEVVNYSRVDDGKLEGYAELSERERFNLEAGESAHTYPLDDGIHMTGNPTLGTIITLSLYGKPVARPYIQGFDLVHRRAFRITSPRRKKAHLAAQALQTLTPHA